MGSVMGCTNNICSEDTSNKRASIDIIKNKNNYENMYTISTSKIEQTKPSVLVPEKEKEEIKEINNEKEIKEKEEEKSIKEEINEEKEEKEDSSEIDNNNNNKDEKEINEDNKEEKIIQLNKIESKQSASNRDSISIKENENNNINIYEKYSKYIKEIKLIQKNYRIYKEKIKIKSQNKSKEKSNVKEKEKLNDKKKLNYLSISNLQRTKTSNSNNKKEEEKFFKNGGKSDIEEIISVDNFNLLQKNSSKILNNFKAMELIKNSMIISSNHQTNLFKMNPEIKNYFSILGDFGEKLSLIKHSKDLSKRFKLTQISLSKNKRENLTKKTKDNIKGNFIQKNEKVVRYQGGFLKKTRKKNGFGIITWSDSSKLKGIFDSNELNGICKFYNNKHKSTFIGEYSNNKPKGFGVYSVKSFSLQGYWESENLNGIAIEVWEDGTYFQGEYKDNKKNGIGLYRWPDGTIYQGEFRDGQMNGIGIMLYSNDCIFSGEIENGYMHGYGNFFWGNGSMYIGYYIQDVKNGFGIYIWDQNNFSCYIGFWEMGKQQGIGAKVNGNKIKYCLWNKGKISVTLKGLYEIDKYLTGMQKGYYQFFTPGYISKLKMNNFYNFNEK